LSARKTDWTYSEAVDYISSLQKRGWRLGLDRMQELMRRLGDPHVGQRFIHIAGTNGKGSVTAYIQAILCNMGLRTGGYFSPYVYDFRERIQICGKLIPKKDVARLCGIIAPISEDLEATDCGGPTEFEFKTSMGFLYWREQACDAVALEVGLGGRLDATNVVDPLVSVITPISLDHKEHLGDTIEQIATEKAGIVKPGRHVISGAGAGADVVRRAAQSVGAPLWELETEVRYGADADGTLWVETPKGRLEGLRPAMIGAFQHSNVALAVGAVHAAGWLPDERVVRKAVAETRLPGRLEPVGDPPRAFLDGAHNPAAIHAVLDALSAFGVRVAVWSAAGGHDAREALSTLTTRLDAVIACPMQHPRALRSEDVKRLAEALGARFAPNVPDALAEAVGLSAERPILVTGSFYLLAEAREAAVRAFALDSEGRFEPA
jgi:dihydrofolate synthase/folylpolyglutamate synthase